MLRGMRGRPRMVSLSKMVCPSKGTSGGCDGREPVPMTMTSPCRVIRVWPRAPITDTACGSTKRACPWKTSIW